MGGCAAIVTPLVIHDGVDRESMLIQWNISTNYVIVTNIGVEYHLMSRLVKVNRNVVA